MEKDMDMEFFIMQMGVSTKEIGKEALNKEKAL